MRGASLQDDRRQHLAGADALQELRRDRIGRMVGMVLQDRAPAQLRRRLSEEACHRRVHVGEVPLEVGGIDQIPRVLGEIAIRGVRCLELVPSRLLAGAMEERHPEGARRAIGDRQRHRGADRDRGRELGARHDELEQGEGGRQGRERRRDQRQLGTPSPCEEQRRREIEREEHEGEDVGVGVGDRAERHRRQRQRHARADRYDQDASRAAIAAAGGMRGGEDDGLKDDGRGSLDGGGRRRQHQHERPRRRRHQPAEREQRQAARDQFGARALEGRGVGETLHGGHRAGDSSACRGPGVNARCESRPANRFRARFGRRVSARRVPPPIVLRGTAVRRPGTPRAFRESADARSRRSAPTVRRAEGPDSARRARAG